ncbi:TetR family transcriptional regulator [Novosphingobium kunmingense]|uniref:TetR family transcriptional regulator n=1 Tax=Novosphingobium kunmingense TaxID=1211806 RepID=A0A2N0I3V2_9SPHN|nr:hypothetical protein [Novosphingobium kunmingense]PKB25878.1 TetR family transcriptional regulator [Novosphingobium kunmingense]
MTAEKSTDERIRDALLAVTAKGLPLTHDVVAHEAQTSRRTVYRRYEDQAALRRAVWALLSPVGVMQGDLDWLLGPGLDDTFGAFDAKSAAMIAAMASAEGRAIRNQKTADRVAYFRDVYADALGDLAEPQRTRALAVLQLLSSGLAWREMRDQWGMDAPAMAAASRWAIKVLLEAVARGSAPDAR